MKRWSKTPAFRRHEPKRAACGRCGHIIPSNRLRLGVCEDRQKCDRYIREFGRKVGAR